MDCPAQQDPDALLGTVSPGVAQTAAITLSLELLSSLGVTGLLGYWRSIFDYSKHLVQVALELDL